MFNPTLFPLLPPPPPSNNIIIFKLVGKKLHAINFVDDLTIILSTDISLLHISYYFQFFMLRITNFTCSLV